MRVLRRAKGAHPTDAWIHFNLGEMLQHATPPRPGEAIEAYTAARALVPELGHELAHLLEVDRRPEEAEAVFRDLVARRPESENHLGCLGHHLKMAGTRRPCQAFPRAGPCRRPKGDRARSEECHVTYQPGQRIHSLGRNDECIAEYRKAIELDPGLAQPHVNLGGLLLAEGKVDEAIDSSAGPSSSCQNPRVSSPAWQGLRAKGRGDEAISVLRTAVELEPKDAECHNELGTALSELKGDYDGAIACFRRVIELDPRVAEGHCNLGVAPTQGPDRRGHRRISHGHPAQGRPCRVPRLARRRALRPREARGSHRGIPRGDPALVQRRACAS